MSRIWHRDRFIEFPGTVSVLCRVCSRQMWLPPSKAALYKTCGQDCAARLRVSIKHERSRICVTCGKNFTPRQVQLTNGQGRFCSVACNTAGIAAVTSPESLAKAQQARRDSLASGNFSHPSGEDHPRWRGGKKAMLARRVESGICREANHRRRLKTKEKIDPKAILSIGERQGWRCATCRCSVRKKYEMDHIMPLALGGAHSIENIQILCPSCNRSKGAKSPVEYAKKLGRLI